jgi:hypothetical protein
MEQLTVELARRLVELSTAILLFHGASRACTEG